MNVDYEIPLEGDDILELPVANPHREACVASLTEMLVMADEGRLRSFVASAQLPGNESAVWGTSCENVFAAGGHMIYAALCRMGFVTRAELDALREQLEG